MNHLKLINEADGLSSLGLHQDAWAVLNTLPLLIQLRPEAQRVRLVICTGLEKWEIGREIAKHASPDSPPAFKEAAGRFYLAHGKVLCAAGDVEGARLAVTALAWVWPEGRQWVLHSKGI